MSKQTAEPRSAAAAEEKSSTGVLDAPEVDRQTLKQDHDSAKQRQKGRLGGLDTESLIDLYRQTGTQHGYPVEQLKVGVHMLGYVAQTTQEAADTFYPGYAKAMTDIGKERGWPPMTRSSFDAQRGPNGALLIGSPDEVTDKILRHSQALGGISRITFQMNAASLPQVKMMGAIDAIGARLVPALHDQT